MKKRILLIVENLSFPFDRRVWREACSLKKAGYEVAVISPAGKDRDRARYEEIGGIRVRRYPQAEAGGNSLSYLIEFANALAWIFYLTIVEYFDRGFVLIHLCNPPDLLFIPALPFRLLGVKILFDHHDLAPDVYLCRPGAGKILYRLLRFFERMTFRTSDAVLSTNDSYRETAIKRGGVSPDLVFVVRNGPRKEEVPDLPLTVNGVHPGIIHALKKSLHGKKLIGYAGFMGPQDGIDTLLRIVRRLADLRREEDFHVLLMGDGSVFASMKDLAIELGIEGLLTFTGRVGYSDILEGISSADFCVCPDPDAGMNARSTLVKIIEYMSLGKTFVAFDLHESRVSAGDSALFAEPGNEADFARKMNVLLNDEELRTGLGLRGRERFLSRLSWETSERNLLTAYRVLLGHSKKSGVAV